jgi:hypothetical protein
VAELKDALPSFDPGHDGWGVVDPGALRGLVRDNVRVIWIRHDPQASDSSSQAVTRADGQMETQAELVRRLARQYHPEVFASPQSHAGVALVLDSQHRVIAHATGIAPPRLDSAAVAHRYVRGETCLDVLTRLLPEFRKTQWSVSGCADYAGQRHVVVYWGIPLGR